MFYIFSDAGVQVEQCLAEASIGMWLPSDQKLFPNHTSLIKIADI